MKISIIWFKRDLRIFDNQALSMAVNNSDFVIPLYIFEKELWSQPDLSFRQYQFLCQSLDDLNQELIKIGQELVIKTGDACKIICDLIKEFDVTALYSHQETWNFWTYQRDKKIAKYLKELGISWFEPKQNGVVRLLKDRNQFSILWYHFMNSQIISAPIKLNKINIVSEKIPTSQELNLKNDLILQPQQGGRVEGIKLLESFLNFRSVNYQKDMSSPVTAFKNCSRLSPHIAFGNLSIREIYQRAKLKLDELINDNNDQNKTHIKSIKSFISRLHWHCHFIQKIEDEPEIEFNNIHKAFDKLNRNSSNYKKSEEYILKFKAWQNGKTGFPMIDACMRSLIACGWLNFRMRAMLMSFASYHLWLDWRDTSIYLARLFIDYEPGIHYSQSQMQSGTTGINSVRIYNPIKQGIDHDKNGIFIKKWLPELEKMPIEFIHNPWLMPQLMNNYPLPIIDEAKSRKEALKKIYDIKKQENFKEESQKIYLKHGSRKYRNLSKKVIKTNQKEQFDNKQLSFL